jgi:hypothetical protein
MKLTSCQRWGSGSLDHTGMPRRTTPFGQLPEQVESDCRFRVLVSRLEIGGYCLACRGSR